MKTTRHAAVLSLVLLGAGAALAQADPTLDQVYRAARAGQVEQAQQMMQQVLRDHPGSAKAQYVEAELLARQGRFDAARQALAAAERLSPGLGFANPSAVQDLRRELGEGGGLNRAAPAFAGALPARSGSPLPWALLLAIGGGALAAWLLMRMGRPAATAVPAPMSPSPGWGPQPNPAWPAPISPMGPYGTGSGVGMVPGLGSRLAGGLATGLGVGAGVMAAEAIGRSLSGRNEPPLSAAPALPPAGPALDGPAFNDDMGGADFGVNDPGSWDDAGAGGSDWDS